MNKKGKNSKLIFKMFVAVILCIVMFNDEILPSFADVTYPNTRNWNLHYYTYDSKLSETVRIVASGNGYYATCTDKGGDCSYNTIRITCTTNSMPVTHISESNMKTRLDPLAPYKNYVDFSINLNYGNGKVAYNAGKIERI